MRKETALGIASGLGALSASTAVALVLDASLNQLVGWSIAGSLAIGAIVLLAVAITRRQPPDSAQVSSSDVNVKMGDGNRVGMIGHRIERPDTESAKND